MNKTRNYRERKQESVSMNILHVIFDTKEMYEKAKTHFDSDGPSPFWAGDWNDETRTIEFAEENSVDTLEVALTADMESAGIEGYHFELADTMELEPEDDKERVRVLCFFDTTDNTKGVLLVTKIDGSLWEKRQAIDNAIRCAFYDQYEAEGVHPADEDEDEFEQVLDKLASGQNADLYEYEIFWENTVMV